MGQQPPCSPLALASHPWKAPDEEIQALGRSSPGETDLPALETVRDRAEDVTNLRTHQDQDGDHDNRNQRDNQRVLHQTLALFFVPHGQLHHECSPLSSPAQTTVLCRLQRPPDVPQSAGPALYSVYGKPHLNHHERFPGERLSPSREKQSLLYIYLPTPHPAHRTQEARSTDKSRQPLPQPSAIIT